MENRAIFQRFASIVVSQQVRRGARPIAALRTSVMAETQSTPPKKDVVRALLLRGSVFVHLDPRNEGVSVPGWLREQPQLVLQVGLDMPLPIPDLRIDDFGVHATLSFQRAPWTCLIPWQAVFALVGEDGKGMVWAEDMPAEIAQEVEREAGRRALRPVKPLDARASRGPVPVPPRAEPAPLTALDSVPTETGIRHEVIRGQLNTGTDEPVRSVAGASRPKRELPPYLRVVK